MIVLDEDTIAQRWAVIGASSEEDRPLLKRAEARDRLSRVEDGHGVSVHCVAESMRQGCDAGEVLEEIQGHPFGLQDGSSIPFDLEETISLPCSFPILSMGGQDEGCIYGLKGSYGSG
jgi:hypothetical protein